MNIIIKKNYLFFKDYKLKCSVGKLGIRKIKKEGDLATPKGIFKLGTLYFRADRNKNLRTQMNKKNQATSNKKTIVTIYLLKGISCFKQVFYLNLAYIV